MRILFWQEQHPIVRGGAETWLRSTAAGLRGLGHAVAWLQDRQVERALGEFRPDAVIMGTLHCFVGLEHVAWLADQKVPAAWMLHDYWPFCGPRMLMQANNRSDRPCEAVLGICGNSCGGAADRRALVNRFHAVTGCEGAAAIMRRNGVDVKAVVEEGIDTALFRPRPGGEPGTVYASAAGDEVWKGLRVLRRALDGTDLGIRFLSGLGREELAEELGRAELYACPSVYEEIWGLALTEAMASGAAVVASDVAGARAQVHEGTGLLVPPGDARALREALALLAADAGLRERLGRAAREHVEAEHSLDATARRWDAVLRGMLKGEGS